MKFLVFGFSVTAEANGYVERGAALRAVTHPQDEIGKVAIGGLQPDHARHLIRDIIAKHQPEALIIEVATAVYRLRPETPAQIADHIAGMEALFAICKERDMHCGIFDLPLTGVEDDKDWMTRTNAALSRTYNVPHRMLPLTEGTLRDTVHPNEEGKDLYAGVFAGLVDDVHGAVPDFSTLAPKRSFDAFAIKDLNVLDAVYRDFGRAGFEEKMLVINAGETVQIALPRPVKVTGLIMRMAPTSGTFVIQRGEAEDRMHCFDRHCYYERVNGKPLKPVITDHLSVFQDPAIPPEELLKGDKDEGPRLGGITHILYEITGPDQS